ncbi:MAG: hypothetical protein K9N55_15130 [Phycisphaerae bacterium]|nr:hypothetical protein [Phycisphaerae bacterium]
MNARLSTLISCIIILFLTGMVQAQTANWTDAAPGDSLWSNPENWDEYPSTDGYWAKIVNGENGATLNTAGEICLKMHIGGDLTFTVMDGAELTMPQDLVISRSGVGTFDMMGGTVNIGRDFEFGFDNPATCNMTGGTIVVTRDVEMPKTGNEYVVHMDLHGGTFIITRNLLMTEGATMDITAGTMIFSADTVAAIQGYIDNGWITAYDGNGTIEMDYDVTHEGQTTVKGVHRLDPSPVDGGAAPAGLVELSWTLPDPCTPGQSVPVDVYFTDDLQALKSFIDPAAIRVVSQGNATSFAVQTVPKTRYYWAVDTYQGTENDPVWGPIFSFLADNIAPDVAASDDVTTWVDNGSVDVIIDATVTDIDPTTSLWTVVSEPDDPNSPDAVIADPTALNTAITLSALGEYVLQLEADDGEKQGSDILTIHVYSDQCEAAKSLPGWQALPGDINLDCQVDQADLDILLEQWLNCNALDCAGN